MTQLIVQFGRVGKNGHVYWKKWPRRYGGLDWKAEATWARERLIKARAAETKAVAEAESIKEREVRLECEVGRMHDIVDRLKVQHARALEEVDWFRGEWRKRGLKHDAG